MTGALSVTSVMKTPPKTLNGSSRMALRTNGSETSLKSRGNRGRVSSGDGDEQQNGALDLRRLPQQLKAERDDLPLLHQP